MMKVQPRNIQSTGQVACHKLVWATAVEMAGALYEDLATADNQFYKLNPNLEAYVKAVAPKLIPQARATLASMLGGSFSESLKAEIEEALILDNELRHLPGM